MADKPMLYQPVPIELPKSGRSKQTKWLVLALILLVCGIPGVGLYWLRQYYRVFEMPATSMEPTIRLEERFLADMHYFHGHVPVRGDVAVIKRNDILIVKRVVALPGDTIEGRNGVIYLNGKQVSEPYIEHIGSDQNDKFLQNFGPTTLKAGECFVLGDNRDRSLDSRHPDFGPIPLTTVVGRPLYILTSREYGRAWERIQ
jgi:signal peptidase I